MDRLDAFFQNNCLHDPDDIDSLLEFASLLRELISCKRYPDIRTAVNYTIEHRYHEAFSWAMGILQEELEKEGCVLENFDCPIGKSIPGYNEFTQRLQVDFHVLKNEVEKVYNDNGEVQSFFNILTYKTGYENIHLVSSENFDTKDNDYILYKLSFVKN